MRIRTEPAWTLAEGKLHPAKHTRGSEWLLPYRVASDLMGELGSRGIPGIVYFYQHGLVQRINGMPQGESLQSVLGPPDIEGAGIESW